MKNGFLEVGIPKSGSIEKHQSAIKELLVAWYQSHAEERFLTKANRFMKQLGVSPAKVSVRDFKSRWGSCSVRGEVTFNWRVIMAPNRVMDYVVVHELSHLVAHDHSEKFWTTIRKIIPDYATDKEWLRTNGKSLFSI
jgi:predicted metal-dependent hydrolase